MAEEQMDIDSFKVPFSQIKNEASDEILDLKKREIADEKRSEEKVSEKTSTKGSKSLINVPLPYKEPEWSGPPPSGYFFEIIKNGTVVSTMNIKKSLFVFGRLDLCDVIFEHPSVSRYHAVIQYCRGDDSHPKGFYLYDLGSTHGTFLNKGKVSPNIYYKLKVGYILKFGGSSRMHIFQGPEEEEKEETKKAVEENKSEEEVCTWGMGEDADEEEDLAINPFAVSTQNEDLYLDDPKKTLRGWFEREGYEVEYNVEEKGFRTFSCTVQLPVDTPSGEFLTVEASVTGKKKEAVVACALEACRTLDRMGLLRQSHQESRQVKRKKKWEENDYYDSDEDTFYDRSGEIEKRREMRKRLASKKPEVENFQSLETKLKTVITEIEEINKKITAYTERNANSSIDASEDSLESYMSSLSKVTDMPADKFEKRKLKLRLIEAEKEKAHLEKLLDIARPAQLPPVVKHSKIIGKRLKSKLLFPVQKTKLEIKPLEKGEMVEEVESDSETESSEKPSDEQIQENLSKSSDSPAEPKKYGLLLNAQNETDRKTENVNVNEIDVPVGSKSDLLENSRTPNLINKSKEKEDEEMDCENIEMKGDKKFDFEKLSPSVKCVKKDNPKKSKKEIDVYATDNNDYCTWTPPANQTGDGMTHLNAKYGY
ncbi:kanadaptin-like [Argiope bruennichi]|uniref:kanadaptin-like n=1 Tax=Argiope bruennichi TaxID=94029 RepID=UPI0024949A80|nr:kanadaptin-like [Argiope bruennichi]